jgi:hypothetical protein
MRLGFVIAEICSLNDFAEKLETTLQDGATNRLCVRLVDLDKKSACGYQRYIPAVGSSLVFNLKSPDLNQNLQKTAVTPYPTDDRSLWCADFLPSEKFSFQGVTATLTENGVSNPVYPAATIVVKPAGDGRFFC